MTTNNLSVFLALFISLLPSYAFALAGIGERTSYFHYNDYTEIIRGHPSDICQGETKWCLVLRKKDNSYHSNAKVHFEELSVPLDSGIPYVIGRRSSDNHWVVYNLQQEKVLMADVNYNNTIDVWYSLGLEEPRYVNGRNTREFLTETEESVFSRWSMDLQLWLFLGVIPFSIIAVPFWYASRKSTRKYQDGNSIVYRLLSYLFLIPVSIFLYIAISSLLEIIKHN